MTEKKIDTLVEDIYELVDKGLPEGYDDEKIRDLGVSISRVIVARLTDRGPRKGMLRMSNIGKPCNRQLYYEVNDPEGQEALPPPARIKFLFGDILEELLLFLAEASGHRVEGRQDSLELEGVPGHRDCVIDGVTTDAKSASTYSFKKFQEGRLLESDPFGYSDQIQSYIEAGQDDPIVTDKDRGAFLVIDKTLGNICLDIHQKQRFPIREKIKYKQRILEGELPNRNFEAIPDGKSGNMKLGMECSYCNFSKKCWPEQRTFLYANRPVTLVEIVREPNVPELIDRGLDTD